ncbi:4-carboxy-4-hydroxy-2-oxoadipate aldolase/oxaloacetate decarboxylase [Paraburkholderia bonniea]|uniref:4-carboxy-4-hydroxy-2-oxoadipate aldolase/oxaloacetate decarboxylase n=1 Tax=Paraburkholderia bonniea TaxID=2152891 RepID=UPI001292BA68|nr:4-carboxy-4-hydroxy-2-oxoadipate aldolase/oxaloacetate decarboxylase [Paraburkholderia bonniea]WJF91925.1 4-carboxy-4-hydroxy-2-oxoadipate aldolase/oxaloacetate decarboxylase [Paraburkholderia bonniea]WJF95244.1 4-carboxy-4-hydroxy-2-oxoadipate aldolase/oxaloacetate decarboxylase [Paraburkholderia bonniea]
MPYPFIESPLVSAAIERPAAAVIDIARAFPTATLLEAANKTGALPSAIKPVSSTFRVCGPAVTVHSPPGDNLWLHRAMVVAQPGDVLVVYTSDFHEAGYWGEVMSTAAKERGIAGLVIDGCVRDADLLAQIGFPVFARGLCIRGTTKDFGARGWINHPVRIGDVPVRAGDLVVGDADGVVVLAQEMLGATLRAAREREDLEAQILERITAGELTLDIYGWNR